MKDVLRRRAALLALYPGLQGSIDELDKEVCEEVQQHPQARRLLTHPAVGPVTALGTEVFLGDPMRFADGKALASYRLASPNTAHTNDFLYFCANGVIQRINFVWGSDSQKPLAWSGKPFIPRAPRNWSSQSR